MPSKGAVKAPVKVIDTILSALCLCIWVGHITHKHNSRRLACMHRLARCNCTARTHARTHTVMPSVSLRVRISLHLVSFACRISAQMRVGLSINTVVE